MQFFTPILTTLGKYSTAQLVFPPLLFIGAGTTARYAYNKYKALYTRKKRPLTEHQHFKLMKHNALVDMMRRKYAKPWYKWQDRDRRKKREEEERKRKGLFARMEKAQQLNAAAEAKRMQERRIAEQRAQDSYIRRLERNDSNRRARDAALSKWNPTNWFRGRVSKSNNDNDHQGPRRRRPTDHDDDRPPPHSPFDHGNRGHHGHNPPHGHGGNRSRPGQGRRPK